MTPSITIEDIDADSIAALKEMYKKMNSLPGRVDEALLQERRFAIMTVLSCIDNEAVTLEVYKALVMNAFLFQDSTVTSDDTLHNYEAFVDFMMDHLFMQVASNLNVRLNPYGLDPAAAIYALEELSDTKRMALDPGLQLQWRRNLLARRKEDRKLRAQARKRRLAARKTQAPKHKPKPWWQFW